MLGCLLHGSPRKDPEGAEGLWMKHEGLFFENELPQLIDSDRLHFRRVKEKCLPFLFLLSLSLTELWLQGK